MVATVSRKTSGGRLLNRELSTLEYNARLLDLAGDDSLPILERVRMCRYVSSNLDEFFMVRVAGLMGQAASGLAVRSADGLTPRDALTQIRERVLELTARQAKVWKKTLGPALAAEGIVVAQIGDLDLDELAELEARFQREIFPVLTPLGVGPGQPFPYISGLSLSLGVLARDPESGEERFARVKVPEGLPRFFPVGDGVRLLLLENVIGHYLDRLFPGMEILERSVFRVTRDADFEVSDEADDLLEAVELELQRRRFGDVVRVEVSSSTSQAMVERLCQGLVAESDQVYEIHGPLDLADLDQLLDLDRPELKFEPMVGSAAVATRARQGASRALRRDPPRRLPRSPALRVVCRQLRGLRPSGRSRSRRDRDEDRRLPDERGQPAHPGVDPVRRRRQAERLSGRAEGPLRRAPQHRVVARTRAGGSARRLRLPRPEGSREDDARRPARGRSAPALCARRDRELPRRDRSLVRGFEPVHGRPCDRGGHRGALQLPDRLRASVAVPEDPRRPVRAAYASDRADSRGRPGGQGGKATPGSGSR